MQWYQRKEYAAGNLRLYLSLFVYKIFGRQGLDIIIFFVTLISFVFFKTVRVYSKNYLIVMSELINIKPTLLNQFKHCYSFAKSLGDKLEIYSDNYKFSDIYFDDELLKKQVYEDIDKGNGVFFLCSHIGSIDVLRMFTRTRENVKVNIFVSKSQSQIFNSFLNKISKISPVNTYCVDEIGIDTSITLKESLDEGNLAFIAADRISENENATGFIAKFLGKDVKFPLGSFKLAQIMGVPIYFIVAVKDKNSKFKVIIKKHNFTDLENLKTDYLDFLEHLVKQYPLQYYQFYDFFEPQRPYKQ